jgi:serine/tyrosine/threonine adenylyltransferase
MNNYILSQTSSQFLPREVRAAHFVSVRPEPVPSPLLVAASRPLAATLGLQPDDLLSDAFLQAFAGNELLPGLDKPLSTVYGCHSYGQWFGQLGDGRAMTLGEVRNSGDRWHYMYNL